jgi:hypothetical protein
LSDGIVFKPFAKTSVIAPQHLRNNEAPSGNASNPNPINDPLQKITSNNQLIDEKGEKYLRESGNIEDLPDPEEEANAEESEQ